VVPTRRSLPWPRFIMHTGGMRPLLRPSFARLAWLVVVPTLASALGCERGQEGTPEGAMTPMDGNLPDAQAYLDAHNRVRAAVNEPAGYVGSWSALLQVTWSNAAAATAQAWANHLRDKRDCNLEHDASSTYGENLAAGTSLAPAEAVELWASEAQSYRYAAQYEFEPSTGHYTQIVWRKTTSIGCASAQCARSTVVVCRYSPPGNVIGASVY
jgi:pathogenesis-related protein 1